MQWNKNCFRCISAFVLVLTMIGAPILSLAGTTDSGKSLESKKDSPENSSPATTVVIGETQYPQLVIGSGDILYITVYGETGGSMESADNVLNGGSPLMTDYQVDSDGTITYPFLGAVQIAGLTPAKASEKIAQLLHKPRRVSVLVKESNTFWVSILGNVGKPGKYQIKGNPTLLSALAEAGGPLPDTDMGGAILIHNNIKARVNLAEYLQGTGSFSPEPFLYPGDALMVRKSDWPSIGDFAILASILASVAVVTVELRH